jgi:hypothetical protein
MKAKNIPTNKIIRLLVMSKEGNYPISVIICRFNKIEIADNGQSYKASYDFTHIQGSDTFYINSHFYLLNDYNFKVEKPTYCEILKVKELFKESKLKYNRKCMKICQT